MATKRWIGNALARPHIVTITVANTWATADTLTVTVNGKDLVLTVGAVVTTAGVAAALTAMWNGDAAVGTETRSETGDDVAEFSRITAVTSGSTVILTANDGDEGIPFTLTVTESTAGSGTATAATTQAATGPWHWDDVDNWDTGTIPVTGINEVQTITIDATGGTFTITFGAATTAALAWNASAATIQAALEGLSTIGTGNITVSLASLVYTCTFKNTLGFQNVAAVTTNAGSLTGGAGTATVATTVAGSTGDDVYVENSTVDILYALDQSAVALNSLNVAANYSGRIGLPDYNTIGRYWEYREKYLKVSATTLSVGYGPGAGSQRIKLNAGSNLCTATIEKMATPAEQGLPALLFVGTNAYNVLNISEGSVGVAVEAGQTSSLLTVRCGYEQSVVSDVSLRLGSGCTLTTLTQSGGELEINSALTTLNKYDGTLTLRGAGTVTTFNHLGGTVYDTHTGTITTLVVASGAVYDMSHDTRAKPFTNKVQFYKGCKFLDPNSRSTFSAGWQTMKCRLKECELDFGPDRSYTVA